MKRSMKPLHSSGVFLYPLETLGIFSFSVDIERDQCHETDQGYFYTPWKQETHSLSGCMKRDQWH